MNTYLHVVVLLSGPYLTYRAVASGVKGGDDYRGPRLKGAPPQRFQLSGQCQPKKSLRTVDGPLLRVVTKACQLLIYQLHMFLTLANLNIKNSLKH